MLSFESDKKKLFAEIFQENSSLDDSGSFVPVFPSIPNMNLHHFIVTSTMVKKVINGLVSGHDFIPVLTLKNSAETSIHISQPFQYLFPRLLQNLVSCLYLMIMGDGWKFVAKNYRHASLLSVASKIFDKLVSTSLLITS